MALLLDKYTEIIKKIEYIRNEIIILQKITNKKLKREKSEEKRKEIYCDFLVYIEKIKKNDDLKKMYKKLKEKEKYVYNILMRKLNKSDKSDKSYHCYNSYNSDNSDKSTDDLTTSNSNNDSSNKFIEKIF